MTAPTNPAPVDVLNLALAALRHCAISHGGKSAEIAHDDMIEAIEAFTGLLHAAKCIQVAIDCGEHEDRLNRSNPLCVPTLRAALAKVQP